MKRSISTDTLGGRLREERDRLGVTQADFAELGGCKRVTQHLYESDARVPDSDYLNRIADRGVDVLYVLRGVRARGLSGETLQKIFQLTEEFGRDATGTLLGAAERESLFMLLCSISSETDTAPSPELVRQISQSRRVA